MQERQGPRPVTDARRVYLLWPSVQTEAVGLDMFNSYSLALPFSKAPPSPVLWRKDRRNGEERDTALRPRSGPGAQPGVWED